MARQVGSAPSIAIRALQTGSLLRLRQLRDAIEQWLDAERDQLALWLPVGIGAGVAAWFMLPTEAGWRLFVLSAAGAGGMMLALGRGGRLAHALGLFVLAAALGCGAVWSRAERVAAPKLDRTIVATFSATIEAVEPRPADAVTRLRLAPEGLATLDPRPPRRNDRRRQTSAVAARIGPTDTAPADTAPTSIALPPHLRVNVPDDDMVAGLTAGARVRLRARLLPPPGASLPGAYDFARVAWFLQLGATGRALDRVQLVTPSPALWRDALANLRQRLTAHIEASLPGVDGGIAAAFVTGDVGAIPQSDSDAMRKAGLAHLLSISGLHVTAVITATMLIVVRLLALSPWLALRWPLPIVAAGFGAIAGISYTLLSGAEVPTIRSCVASLLVLASIITGRQAITLRLVATGALVILLLWPEALVGPSFQLSFAAVTTIIALHDHPWIRAAFLKRDESIVRRIGREVASLLLTGLAVEAALAPIGLYFFHRAGLYGALANIVAIPLTTFVVMPFEALALLLDAVGLGAPMWWLAGRSIALLLWIAHVTAALPGASAALPSMPTGAFALMIVGGLWLLLWRTRMRRLGLLPLIAGAAWAFATPAPDILVTGDGRHVAVRTADGRLALLRDRAGDYVRDMLGTAAGVSDAADPFERMGTARCNPDLCRVDLAGRGRSWRLLATRSPYQLDLQPFAAACTGADIVVSDRRLPRGCTPRWIRADPQLLAQTGGLTIGLASQRVTMVAVPGDEHPWLAHGKQRWPQHPAVRAERSRNTGAKRHA